MLPAPSTPLKPPSLLKFHVDSFWGGPRSLEWDGSHLWCFRLERDPTDAPIGIWEALSPPGKERWEALWLRFKEAGAWHWPRRSEDPGVMDGEEWSLKLRWGRHRWPGGGYHAKPDGFEPIEDWLEEAMEAPRVPGIPSPFHVMDLRSDRTWDFRWNGRVLAWASFSFQGPPETSGRLSDLSADQWLGYREACRSPFPLNLRFEGGRYAGISIQTTPPRDQTPVENGDPSISSFVDPHALITALKTLVLDHPSGQ